MVGGGMDGWIASFRFHTHPFFIHSFFFFSSLFPFSIFFKSKNLNDIPQNSQANQLYQEWLVPLLVSLVKSKGRYLCAFPPALPYFSLFFFFFVCVSPCLSAFSRT